MGADESRAPAPPDNSHPAANGMPSYLLDTAIEHTGPITCMALADDHSVLATGSDDRTVRLWTTNTARCECLGALVGHNGYITCLVIEGIHCVSGSVDWTVRKATSSFLFATDFSTPSMR